jgi:hypothetical protein
MVSVMLAGWAGLGILGMIIFMLFLSGGSIDGNSFGSLSDQLVIHKNIIIGFIVVVIVFGVIGRVSLKKYDKSKRMW